MMADFDPQAVNNYYGLKDLTQKILTALTDHGFDIENLTRENLFTFDEFHIRGLEATTEMIELAGVRPGMRILDIGSGIGGPARTLAAVCDCHVTGIDVTEEFVAAAKELSARVGLAEKNTFVVGSALELPFTDEAFDLVWLQHVNMNIPDKRALLAEARRVLRSGGVISFYEILAGREGAHPAYPAPWASQREISFLETGDTIRDLVREVGLREESWRDVTEISAQWFAKMLSGPPPDKPRLTMSLINGSDFLSKARNVLAALEDGRLTVAQAIFTRPSR
ncbi:MAG TPA: class I SAM-dependent methyltransferase [candidate division Zixibacteria bacterium]|nr:class I SAM-dependent methyltransferase [candidate division Zixibacteria bacterium]